MKLAFLSFTRKGHELADRLAEQLGGTSDQCREGLSLENWTAAQFRDSDALIFVGAAGIAVRAIAPFIEGKTKDPAVVVVDECARFAIPVLSGHLGGANDLARSIARVCGAEAVITTATDANGVFAVDEWARRQGCLVANPDMIKRVSGTLLAGNEIRLCSEYPISGDAPENVVPVKAAPYDVYVGTHTPTIRTNVLWLVPQNCVVGIGCRRGSTATAISAAVLNALRQWSISELALSGAASIDLKKDEKGLLAYCAENGWELQTFSAEELGRVPGSFTASDFVNVKTGVDNVCERSAVLASGGGTLCGWKCAFGGVTAALAIRPVTLDWTWQDTEPTA